MLQCHIEETSRCPNCNSRIGLLKNYNLETDSGHCSYCNVLLPIDFPSRRYFKCETQNHKSGIKLFINPILRRIQFWTMKPYVIASICNLVEKFPNYYLYEFVRYKFLRVHYEKNFDLAIEQISKG